LEFLARAALTKIHPALNADPEGDGLNLLYAFGFDLKGQPKSLPIHAVLLRLQKILPDEFNKPRREFCDFFSNVRNQELHTSDLPFESLSETKWLARFYDVCDVLCKQLKKNLSELFGTDEAGTAEGLIKALKAEKLSAVKSKISAHKKVFDEKAEEDRKSLRGQQKILSLSWRTNQTKVTCPACKCLAKLDGILERVSKPFYDEGELLVKNVILASRMECKACGLVLADVDELHIAEIEPHFEFNEATELHEYQEEDYGPVYNNM
jgi:hypothetical protein